MLAHRRLLAALLAAVAVLAALRAVEPPPTPSVPVLVAAHDLPAGQRLEAGDLTVVHVAPEHRPRRAVAEPVALGRTLAAPLGAGEPVSDLRLVSEGLLDTAPGTAAVPVRVPDAGVVALLAVGDVVDVLATAPRDGAARTVAPAARVLALPAAVTEPAAASSPPPGRLVVLGVPTGTAGTLAAAAVRDYVSLVWTG